DTGSEASGQAVKNADQADVKKYMKYGIKSIDYLTGLEFYDNYKDILKVYSYVVPGLDDDRYLLALDTRSDDSLKVLVINNYKDGLDLVQEAYEVVVTCHYEDHGLEVPVKWQDYAEDLSSASQVVGVISSLHGIYLDSKELRQEIENDQTMTWEEKEAAYQQAEELRDNRLAYAMVATALPLIVASGGMAAPVLLFSGMLSAMGYLSDKAFEYRRNMIRGGSAPVDWNNDLGTVSARSADGFSCNVSVRCEAGERNPYNDGKRRLYIFYTISVSGEGAMRASLRALLLQIEEKIKTRYSAGFYIADSEIEMLTINDGITRLTESMWGGYSYRNPTVRKMEIPKSLTAIDTGYYYTKTAGPSPDYDLFFHYDESLPSGVLSHFAFTSITLPSHLKRIEDKGLVLSEVESITIPASVEYIGNEAIGGTKLSEVIFLSEFENSGPVFERYSGNFESAGPRGGNYDIQYAFTERVPDHFFENAGVHTVVLDPGIHEIGKDAFRGSLLREVDCYCPETLIIYDGAFHSCTSLQRLHFAAQEIQAQTDSFRSCTNLTSVYVPNRIDAYRHDNFSYTKWVYCGGSLFPESPLYTAGPASQGNLKYNVVYEWTEMTAGYFSAFSTLTDITFPEGITYIAASAFKDCSNLAEIDLPEGLTDIGNDAFAGCSSLTEIDLPEGLKTIGYEAFYRSGLRSITIPESVEEIYGLAFSCTKITSMDWPGRLDVINPGLFSGCENLKHFDVPEGVKIIGNAAF
ncbi:MAG: leucine-rich repeat protein, partial [Butyrivibrio sp.]|nr:leucine-rich repeat protein [Butyrivibrio sp.]